MILPFLHESGLNISDLEVRKELLPQQGVVFSQGWPPLTAKYPLKKECISSRLPFFIRRAIQWT